MVLSGSTVELRPPPLYGTPTGITSLRGILVMGLTKQNRRWRGSDGSSTRWRSMHEFIRSCAPPLTPRPTLSTTYSTTLVSIIMLKSYKDLSLGEESVYVGMSECLFHSVFSLSSWSMISLVTRIVIFDMYLSSNYLLQSKKNMSQIKILTGHGFFLHTPIALSSVSNTCMIVTLMSSVDSYGYALLDTNISYEQFHI
jgi:hypothetical protein